ncbi:hypothetical protein AURDEDRAFT_181024 [Auricularia subglabra TFB-10046 SS5]|nr:hypothetical protein AURDEDRAFT_181024 [Auricularia subglabra TFB-10046 SS5]
MPPKPSNALVPRGVSGLANKQKAGGVARTGRGNADDRDKQTTSLVLRHGQGGIWQSGEVVLKGGHYSGPQKLAFRANNLIKQGVLAPFQFTQLLNIAWSQMDLNLRTVERLVDYHDFYRDMKAAIEQRPEVCFARARGEKRDFLKDKTFVATQVSARIHNLFFVASAWRMIWTILVHIGDHLDQDTPVRLQLAANDTLRDYFLVLYDCINDVIEIGRQQVSQLIVASEYYNKYFTITDDNQVQFNSEHIREAHKSLLTTIMLELALTNSSYPLNILMSSLGDVIADAPKGKHRIGQGLWDAIGDLSVAVDFRGQLDAALTANKAEFKQWFDNPPAHMEGYRKYKEAIELSEEASQLIDNFKDIIAPLERTENPEVLIKMWRAINENYAAVAGKNIEALWLLEGAWEQQPRWRTYHLPELGMPDSDDDGFASNRKRVQLHKAKRRDAAPQRKARLLIANVAANADDDDDDDLPELLDVSDSSEEEDSESEEEDDYEEDDESDYDEDDMEQLDDLMREAQQYKFESPEDNPNVPADVGDNPFIRMMKGLKGRFASLNPRTKPTEAGRVPDARLTVDEQKGQPKKPTPKPAPKAGAAPPKAPPAPPQPSGTKVTVEEVVDEEAGGVSAAKKKKKKKKKKPAKKTDSEAIAAQEAADDAPATPPPPSPSPAPAPAVSPASPAKKPAEKKKPAPPKPVQANPIIREYDPSMSLLSLSLGPETAQSARSYLAQQGSDAPKAKVKSRPADTPAPEKRSLFSRLRRDHDEADDREREKKPADAKKTKGWGIFSGMKKKASRTLKRIIAPGREERGKQSMKWEEFERAMQHMGFTVDGSTAGSSVRFTPPNNDQPITFHKPHPDSTIHPVMLLEFSKRLKEKYGWTEEMFASYDEDD